MDKIAVRDNGIMKVERGACVNKKFKYFNTTSEQMNIEVFSNMPQIICVKTTLITIPAGGGFDFIKFLVLAPQTPCYIDGKILIRNLKTSTFEELIIFRVDID